MNPFADYIFRAPAPSRLPFSVPSILIKSAIKISYWSHTCRLHEGQSSQTIASRCIVTTDAEHSGHMRRYLFTKSPSRSHVYLRTYLVLHYLCHVYFCFISINYTLKFADS
jgi:hypothetical protein